MKIAEMQSSSSKYVPPSRRVSMASGRNPELQSRNQGLAKSCTREVAQNRPDRYTVKSRITSQSNHNGTPFDRDSPPYVPKPLDVPWSLYNQNDDQSQDRKAARPLHDSKDWFEQLIAQHGPATSDEYKAATFNDIWHAFVDRDNFMDIVKKFNNCNIERLKEMRGIDDKKNTPAEFESQIRSCVAKPELYPSTWKYLVTIYTEKALIKYIEACEWCEEVVGSSKISAKLRKRLNGKVPKPSSAIDKKLDGLQIH